MKWLYSYLLGYVDFSFRRESKAYLLNALLQKEIGCIFCRMQGDVGYIRLQRRDAAKIGEDMPWELLRTGGLLSGIQAFIGRPGLLIGCIFGILLLVASSFTVWRVEVEGNAKIGSSEIEAGLAKAGLSVGDLSPFVDTAAVRARFLRDNPEIAWLGLYIRGTTVAVEVREISAEAPKEEERGLYNLVASHDAVVESIRVDSGRATVSIGQTVRAGELLVSGIYKTAEGLSVVPAAGEIYGKREDIFEVLQPKFRDEKQPEKARLCSFSLTFFQKDIKLFQKNRHIAEKYDIIKRKEQIVLFNRIALPIYYTREYCVPYTENRRPLTEEEMVKAAFSRMKGILSEALTDSQLLRKELVGEFTEEGYLLRCRAEFVTEISLPQEFFWEENGG